MKKREPIKRFLKDKKGFLWFGKKKVHQREKKLVESILADEIKNLGKIKKEGVYNIEKVKRYLNNLIGGVKSLDLYLGEFVYVSSGDVEKRRAVLTELYRISANYITDLQVFLDLISEEKEGYKKGDKDFANNVGLLIINVEKDWELRGRYITLAIKRWEKIGKDKKLD